MDVPVKKKMERGEVEPASDRPRYLPDVDIFESEEGVTVLADLPGVAKEGVSLVVEQGVLTLSGRTRSCLPEAAEALYRESADGDYHRAFRIGHEFDGEKMDAALEDGVLRIFIPKSDWAKTKKIDVK